MFNERRFGVRLLLAALVHPLAAQAAVKQGSTYAAESARGSIVELSSANLSDVARFAFNLPGTPAGLCFGGPNDDLYVAVGLEDSGDDAVFVVTQGGDMSNAEPFATGFSIALGLDCTQDRVLIADYHRGIFDITAGGDFKHAEPFAVSPRKHIDVFTDSKGATWMSAGIAGLYDISEGGLFSYSDRFVAYDLPGKTGIVGIGELAGELHVTEGSYYGSGKVWNVGGMRTGSRLSDGTEYAAGVPYMANSLLGVGADLLVTGHPNDCSGGTAIWNVSLGGDVSAQEPAFSGIGSACYLMEELAYAHYCGDGILRANSAEQCDTVADSPNCDVDCTFVQCGDGHVNAEAGETCDDGNARDGDDCPATCGVDAEPDPPPAKQDGMAGAPASAEDPSNTLPGSEPASADPAASEPEASATTPTATSGAGCTVARGSSNGGIWAALALALGLVAARRRR